mgnify:CR=1 FL=1
MRVTNYLLGYENLKIIQDNEMFNFSLDSVLLPNFITINESTKNILDIGTGNAPIPLILSEKTKAKIIGLEIQKEVSEMAKESVKMNNLENRITIICEDAKEYAKTATPEFFDIITCNPPYFEVKETSRFNKNDYKTIARHEVKIDLEGIISSAAYLLDNKGRFAIVHRPDRMIDILNIMQKYDIEPKRIRFVYPKMNRESHVLLVEGMYKGKKGIKIESPLYAHNDDGSYSNEVRKMFGEKIDE